MSPPRIFPEYGQPLARQRGMSLIELMVGMVVALVISLVMFNTLLYAEGQRRSTSGSSDAQQAGTLASYAVERIVRMGGAGMTQVGNFWGQCKLSAQTSAGTTLLPLPTSLPAPFAGLAGIDLRAAPVLIANGSTTTNNDAADTTPDALVVLGGNSPNLNTWFQGTGTPTTSTTAHVMNSIGLATGDAIVAVEQAPGQPNYGSGGKCRFVQVTSAVASASSAGNYRMSSDQANGQVITVGGTLTPSDGLAPAGNPYITTQFVDLGPAPGVAGALPIMQILALGPAVSAPSELRALNVLRDPGASDSVVSLADGIVNLQAVYGITASPKPTVGNTCEVASWVPPTGAFSIGSLTDGTGTLNLQRICAVRIAMISRSAIKEKSAVDTNATWTLFGDDPSLTVTGTRTGDALKFRYRQYDVIVPIRNQLN